MIGELVITDIQTELIAPNQIYYFRDKLVVRSADDWIAKFLWCRKTFDADTWNLNLGDWYFNNREDAMLFIMRWS